MNKYNDIEIQTAKNLLKKGFKWIARDSNKCSNCLYAYTLKPNKGYSNGKDAVCWRLPYDCYGVRDCVSVCSEIIPIFQSVCSNDKEPTSLEAIVHPQILDDAERRYLSAVIRPFRETVMWIKKYNGTYSEVNYESIVVCVEGDFARKTPFSFCLPAFKKGTMYKGMERGKNYKPEELGL